MADPSTLTVQALLLAERLETRGLERRAPALPGPVVLAPLPGGGQAIAFRWGVVVTFGALPGEAEALAARLAPNLHDPLAAPVAEQAVLRLDAAEEGAGQDGAIRLADFSLPRLALVADALAKSAVLAHQEAMLARTLDRLEPLLGRLRRGRLGLSPAALLPLIGEAIAARAHAAARVDTAAQPDLVWDHPELAPLHAALAAEWELADRTEDLSGKLDMVRETSETLLSLAEARRSRLLEIAVVVLIATEVATTLYGLFNP
jgi:uncharacterized Rmd1/YagE family protein